MSTPNRPDLFTPDDFWATLGLTSPPNLASSARRVTVSTARPPTATARPTARSKTAETAGVDESLCGLHLPRRRRRSIEKIARRWGIDNGAAIELALNFERQQGLR